MCWEDERDFCVKSGWFPVGAYVPAGPQDSSVWDAGHSGHWAQRVIEASPVQNRIRQDGGTGHCYCFFFFFVSFESFLLENCMG